VGLAAAARLGALVVGVPIAVSGIFGAMAVIAVNSWMNTPGGFTEVDGQITSVNVWQVFFSRSAIYEMPHMILAAYMVAGFGVASVYAVGILRGRRTATTTPVRAGFVPAAVLTPFQIFVGDTAARPSRTTSRSSSRPWSTWHGPPGRSRSGWAGPTSTGTSMPGSRSLTWTHCWSGSGPVPRSSAGTACPRPTGHRWCG